MLNELIFAMRRVVRDFGDIEFCYTDNRHIIVPRYFGVTQFVFENGISNNMAYISLEPVKDYKPSLTLVKKD